MGSFHLYVADRWLGRAVCPAREPEPESEAVEPSIFSGAGAGDFINISLEPEQQKILLAPTPGLIMANFSKNLF